MAAIDGFIQWLDSSEAALGLFIAVVGAVASGWFSWHQRSLARRERAADLFDSFYSLENYHAMVAPVFGITVLWNALSSEKRVIYAAALCKGWMGQDRALDLVTAYDPVHPQRARLATLETLEEAHFRRGRSTEEITEHAALTAFLYFWVKLQAMLDARLVSPRLTKKLFREPYAIYAQFIANFRQAVLDNPDTASVRPPWIEATRELEMLLLGRPVEPQRLDWSLLAMSAREAEVPASTIVAPGGEIEVPAHEDEIPGS